MKGHVHKRGKTYTYVIDAAPDPLTGKRKQISKGGYVSEKDAWRACRSAIKRIEDGHHVTPSLRTLGLYLLDEWLPAIQAATKPTTWANWKVYAESYVVPVLGKVKLQELSAPRLQALYGHLLTTGRVKVHLGPAMYELWQRGRDAGKEPTPRQLATATGASIHAARAAVRRFRAGRVPTVQGPGLAPKTVRNVHVMLHKALADAVSWHFVVENVAEVAKPPRPLQRKPTIWTPAQLAAFLRANRADRFFPLYLLAATTGLRRAELCGLRWSAIDLDGGTLAVEPDTRVVVNGQAQDSDGKTGTSLRLLSLDSATVAVLREWKTQQDSERVFFGRDYDHTNRIFTWENGRVVHPDVIRQRFNRLSARCGLPHIRLHDIRHSYATAALKSGINPKIVSQRLGHASVAFTLSVYSHALPGIDREAATTMAGLILGEDQIHIVGSTPDSAVSKSVSNEDEDTPSDDL